MTSGTGPPTTEELAAGVRAGDRGLLSRAITLVESTRESDRVQAQRLLDELGGATTTGSAAVRVGVTGVPGAGKSTFIDALGSRLILAGGERSHRVAVLAVDPTSQTTGGSILGDKTRMEHLARSTDAYIRPSPAGDAAGGVAPRTREAMLLCEAAGFDVILVETVGTGQSELAVAHMVDTFVLLTLAGAGDELQGIKRGVMELADVIVVHKSDAAAPEQMEQTRVDYLAAQRLLRGGEGVWTPPVLPCSALTGAGLDEVWAAVLQHRTALGPDGLVAKRSEQALHWFEECVADLLRRDFLADAGVTAALPELRRQVLDGAAQPMAAAQELLRRRQRS